MSLIKYEYLEDTTVNFFDWLKENGFTLTILEKGDETVTVSIKEIEVGKNYYSGLEYNDVSASRVLSSEDRKKYKITLAIQNIAESLNEGVCYVKKSDWLRYGRPRSLPKFEIPSESEIDELLIEEIVDPERRVVCAAMLMNDGEIVTGIRHYSPDMRKTMRAIYGEDYHKKVKEQGFVDQFGDFLSREQAHEIAKKNGQIIRKCGGDEGKLFSENLY